MNVARSLRISLEIRALKECRQTKTKLVKSVSKKERIKINDISEAVDVGESAKPNGRGALIVTYVLYGVGIFFPLLTIVGLIVAHLKAGETKESWVGTHFHWLIRTFWFSVLWSVVVFAVAILTLGIGSAILALIVGVWYIFRVVRGALALSDETAMY